MGPLDLNFRPSNMDFSRLCSMHSLDGSLLTTYNPLTLTSICNVVHSNTSVGVTSVDDPSSLSRFHTTFHAGRVDTVDCHDMGAWIRERKAHYTKHRPVAVSFSLGSNYIVTDDYSVDVAKSKFALMEPVTQGPRVAEVAEEFANAAWLHGDTVFPCPHKWTPLALSDLDISPIQLKVITGSQSPKGLSEGRRRVGEILVRCGVIDVSGFSPAPPTTSRGHTSARPTDLPATISGIFELSTEDNDLLVTALADWTSEWVYALVIQPYLRGNFCFRFQSTPIGASASTAPRIRQVLSGVYNPVQVAIHALWFIGTLTGNDIQSNIPFLSIPIIRYLHNNGTFVAEDFMFRIFVACAMIGDKTVNDTTLSTNTWNRLTRIPQVILNATEKHALNCLKWNVVMTENQWQKTIVYLRFCIKMGSAFNPFAYDEASSPSIVAHYLDELICLGHVNEHDISPAVGIMSPQPVRHSTHWEVLDSEWCPEVDPIVNQKPRCVGIAPGSLSVKVGMTAKDLLDSILGSSKVPNLGHLAHPVGTSFCGSFGAIGARFAQTIKMASTCHSSILILFRMCYREWTLPYLTVIRRHDHRTTGDEWVHS